MSSFGSRVFRRGGFGGLEALAVAGMYGDRGGDERQSLRLQNNQGNIAHTLAEQAHTHDRSNAVNAQRLFERKTTFLNGIDRNSDGFHENGITENNPTLKDATDATIAITKATSSIAAEMDKPKQKPTPGTPQPFSPTPFKVKASAPGIKPKTTRKNTKPPAQGSLF